MSTHLSKILSHYTAIEQLRKGEMCKPRFVDLHISNACNQKCDGCAYKGLLDVSLMTKKDAFNTIKQFIDFGVKGFDFAGGGEPLVLPYLSELWNYIKERNCYFGVITNGTMLDPNTMDQIIEQGSYIRISLEATNIEDYCLYKNVAPYHWLKVSDNISYLVAKKRHTKSNCEIGLKYAVGESFRGHHHYLGGVGLGLGFGVDNVQFKALRHEPEELSLKEKEMENYYLLSVKKEAPKDFVRSWIVPHTDIPQCWLNPLHTVVDHLGNIYLCCYYYYRDNHCIGNILKDSLEELWFSDKHKEMIKSIKKEECAVVDCKFFHHHNDLEKAMLNGRWEFL